MSSDQALHREHHSVLLLEGINPIAATMLREAGYRSTETFPRALDPDMLATRLAGVHVLGIRSRTRIDAAALQAAPRLVAVGSFTVGTDHVDLAAAQALGIPVFNGPFSNTRSVAELVVGQIVMLMRRIFPRSDAAHRGVWDKSSDGSHELRGRTLGIVGYGNTGAQTSVLAEAMGMRVIFHDIAPKLRLGNAEPVGGLHALLSAADVVSLHVPQTPATEGMIGAAEIAVMKPGAFLINTSRGTTVQIDALAAALRDGHLAGAAVDVFPIEPTGPAETLQTPLQGMENVILTPHIGGSTVEAQERIGAEVAHKLCRFLDTGATEGCVNLPQMALPPLRAPHRLTHVHHSAPAVMRNLAGVFEEIGCAVAASHLQVDAGLGYAAIDTELPPGRAAALLRGIGRIEGTIRARLLAA